MGSQPFLLGLVLALDLYELGLLGLGLGYCWGWGIAGAGVVLVLVLNDCLRSTTGRSTPVPEDTVMNRVSITEKWDEERGRRREAITGEVVTVLSNPCLHPQATQQQCGLQDDTNSEAWKQQRRAHVAERVEAFFITHH